MEEGSTKQAAVEASGNGEHANGRAYAQEPLASYLTLDSLMKCGFVRWVASSCGALRARARFPALPLVPGSTGMLLVDK